MKDLAILRRGLVILEGMIHILERGDRIDITDASTVLKVFLSSEHIDEQELVAAVERALRFRKGLDFVQSSRHLAVALRRRLEPESVEPEIGAAGSVINDAVPEKFVNLTRLEYKYAQGTPGAMKARIASASYGT